MRFARRLAFCVVAVLAMSVLAALVWDKSDQATAVQGQVPDPTSTAARP